MISSEDIFSTDILTRGRLQYLFEFPLILSNVSARGIADAAKQNGQRTSFRSASESKVLYSRQIEIRDEIFVSDGLSGEGSSYPIEMALQAVLDGPVHVLSRLFTKKGHHIGKFIEIVFRVTF